MTPKVCQAARALIGYSSTDLADAAGVGKATVWRFEAGETVRQVSVDKMAAALEQAGVIFIAENGDGPGVRLKKPI